MKGFTIFIPVYNEEKIIKENTKRLDKYLRKISKRYNVEYEIIIVSNGSTDKTDEIGKNIEGDRIRFYSISERGVGLAFKQGLRHSHYNHIITVDMDLSIDLGFIEEALLLVKSGMDIVVGSKKNTQERKWYRLVLSGGFIFLTKTLLGLSYTDYSIAAKCWEKSFVHEYADFIDSGSSYVINLLAIAKEKGKKIKEIDVICVDDRPSKFNLVHEVFYRFFNLIAFYLEMKSRKFYK